MTEPSQPAPPAAAPRAATLLLVDDETSVLSALRRLFRMNGYAIEQAASGAEGLEILARKPIDLVISDMRMPVMDGAAFLERVRESHPETVRILLTGYADIGSTIAAINRGEIHRYIAKPWDDQDLLLLVREALRRRDLERQNAELLALTRTQNAELQDLNRTLEARVAARTAELEQINAMLEASYEEVNAQFTMAITVFSSLLEMRQGRMAGHARRVSDLAGRMARLLGMNERQRQDVVLGALLHDIGKLGFPDEMLAKPVSKYNAQEMTRYQRHPVDGEAALLALDRLRPAAQIVRQHHERLDGRGFPDRLAGEDICLGARIVAAASDYDGLESGHLGEQSFSAAQARQALLDSVGSRHEARVVQALFDAAREIEEEEKADVEIDLKLLKPQMVLARPLLSPKGAILLPAGHKFDAPMILRITELADRFGVNMSARVLQNSLPPGMVVRPAGAGLQAA